MWDGGKEFVVGGEGHGPPNLSPIIYNTFFTCLGFHTTPQFPQNV